MNKSDKKAQSASLLAGIGGETEAVAKGRAALRPDVNALLIIDTFKGNFMGQNVDVSLMMTSLQNSIQEVKDGNLSHLEAMLLGQATALQSMFTSFAIKASSQQHMPNYQAFMGMALKSQAQCRATLQTLVELKNPRQATFVNQANIAHGPQQVNNGIVSTSKASHAKKSATSQNKLLEQDHEQDQAHRLDAAAAGTAGRADSTMATLEKIHRPQKRRR